MPVFTFDQATLKLSFETGIDESGKSIIASKTYRNVRDQVSAVQVFTVVQALAGLTKHHLLYAQKIQTEMIDN